MQNWRIYTTIEQPNYAYTQKLTTIYKKLALVWAILTN